MSATFSNAHSCPVTCDKAAFKSGILLTQIVSYRTSDVEASNFPDPDLHPGRETSKS